jgi:hypothetical protein
MFFLKREQDLKEYVSFLLLSALGQFQMGTVHLIIVGGKKISPDLEKS